MSNAVNVWREFHGEVQPVGTLSLREGQIVFSYDPAYKGSPISNSLPKGPDPASAAATETFFSALIPEGSARKELERMFRTEKNDFVTYLEHLNDESIGALLFSVGDDAPYENPRYEQVEESFFDKLASRSLETSVLTAERTRLSLAGAMAKVGLYRDEGRGGWFYPFGAAPSTHIVKAADGERFPLETVNEALCLGVARRCGFPAADCELIPVGSGEPLIAVRRFDRVFENSSRMIDGMRAPMRLHQEDMSQATAIPLKYEPTDGSYLSLIARTVSHVCANSFGEASLVLEYTMLDYLVGNCDNHLKNYSLLFSEDWETCEAAPLYDVVSTVAYPNVYREMGVSFGGSRRIDEVTRELFSKSLSSCGIPEALGFGNFRALADAVPGAVEEEADALEKKGFPQVRKLLKSLLDGVSERSRKVLG